MSTRHVLAWPTTWKVIGLVLSMALQILLRWRYRYYYAVLSTQYSVLSTQYSVLSTDLEGDRARAADETERAPVDQQREEARTEHQHQRVRVRRLGRLRKVVEGLQRGGGGWVPAHARGTAWSTKGQ